jgi:uncharacterized membrane protein YbhN (UPF0104 family)
MLSVLASFSAWVIVAYSWKWFLRKLGQQLTFKQSYVATMLPQLGRYVPGKIWAILGTQYYSEKFGATRDTALYASFLNPVCFLLGTAFLGVFYIVWSGQMLLDNWGWVVLAVLTGVFLMVIHPRIFSLLVNLVIRIFHWQPFTVRLSYGNILVLIIFQMVSAIFLGVSFCFFSAAVGGITWGQYPEVALSFVTAAIIGNISVFAPGGIGVRESVLMILLPKSISPGILLVMVFGGRIWATVVQLAAIGIAALINTKLFTGRQPYEDPVSDQ